eukprot:1000081-Prymnesium_polylepis.1
MRVRVRVRMRVRVQVRVRMRVRAWAVRLGGMGGGGGLRARLRGTRRAGCLTRTRARLPHTCGRASSEGAPSASAARASAP